MYVRIGDNVRIKTMGIDFNLPELIRFYREHRFKDDGNGSTAFMPIALDANDTAIVFADGRSAKADAIALQYANNQIDAQLYKGKGKAVLEVKNDGFYLYGNNLDDDNTTIYDYVLLNNLFAFINTVPALVTFSLPSYASKGIKINSAYADLKYHEGNLTVSGIKVDSDEMDFAGQGVIDYTTNTMNMNSASKRKQETTSAKFRS